MFSEEKKRNMLQNSVCGNVYTLCIALIDKQFERLYNMVRYSTVIDIRQFKDGSQSVVSKQKSIDHIDQNQNVIFLYKRYIFVRIQHGQKRNKFIKIDRNEHSF